MLHRRHLYFGHISKSTVHKWWVSYVVKLPETGFGNISQHLLSTTENAYFIFKPFLVKHNNGWQNIVLTPTTYLKRPFSVKTTFVHRFMKLGLGLTIEKSPSQLQSKAGIASAQAVPAFPIVCTTPQLSYFRKVLLNN
jgi:hypothetical protein